MGIGPSDLAECVDCSVALASERARERPPSVVSSAAAQAEGAASNAACSTPVLPVLPPDVATQPLDPTLALDRSLPTPPHITALPHRRSFAFNDVVGERKSGGAYAVRVVRPLAPSQMPPTASPLGERKSVRGAPQLARASGLSAPALREAVLRTPSAVDRAASRNTASTIERTAKVAAPSADATRSRAEEAAVRNVAVLRSPLAAERAAPRNTPSTVERAARVAAQRADAMRTRAEDALARSLQFTATSKAERIEELRDAAATLRHAGARPGVRATAQSGELDAATAVVHAVIEAQPQPDSNARAETRGAAARAQEASATASTLARALVQRLVSSASSAVITRRAAAAAAAAQERPHSAATALQSAVHARVARHEGRARDARAAAAQRAHILAARRVAMASRIQSAVRSRRARVMLRAIQVNATQIGSALHMQAALRGLQSRRALRRKHVAARDAAERDARLAHERAAKEERDLLQAQRDLEVRTLLNKVARRASLDARELLAAAPAATAAARIEPEKAAAAAEEAVASAEHALAEAAREVERHGAAAARADAVVADAATAVLAVEAAFEVEQAAEAAALRAAEEAAAAASSLLVAAIFDEDAGAVARLVSDASVETLARVRDAGTLARAVRQRISCRTLVPLACADPGAVAHVVPTPDGDSECALAAALRIAEDEHAAAERARAGSARGSVAALAARSGLDNAWRTVVALIDASPAVARGYSIRAHEGGGGEGAAGKESPLHLAARLAAPREIVARIVAALPELILAPDAQRRFPAHVAASTGRRGHGALEALLCAPDCSEHAARAQLTSIDSSGRNPVAIAIASGATTSTVRMMLRGQGDGVLRLCFEASSDVEGYGGGALHAALGHCEVERGSGAVRFAPMRRSMHSAAASAPPRAAALRGDERNARETAQLVAWIDECNVFCARIQDGHGMLAVHVCCVRFAQGGFRGHGALGLGVARRLLACVVVFSRQLRQSASFPRRCECAKSPLTRRALALRALSAADLVRPPYLPLSHRTLRSGRAGRTRQRATQQVGQVERGFSLRTATGTGERRSTTRLHARRALACPLRLLRRSSIFS